MKPKIMSIINLTDDSFFKHEDGLASALLTAKKHVEEGADILDIGAESTRPGADFISEGAELERLVPFILEIRKIYPNIPISVDTYKASVADRCLNAGADIINDITAGGDKDMLSVAEEHDARIVLMHMRGTPATMNDLTQYDDIIRELEDYFRERIDACLARNIRKENIILDPGFGFAKTKEQNLFLLDNLDFLKYFACPVLAGVSHKRFVAAFDGDTADDRLYTSVAANIIAMQRGAQIFRVHDTLANRQALDFVYRTEV